jgi:hypothetical protein
VAYVTSDHRADASADRSWKFLISDVGRPAMEMRIAGTKFVIGRLLLPKSKTDPCPPFDRVHANFLVSLIKTKMPACERSSASWSHLRSRIAMYPGIPPGPMMAPIPKLFPS